MPKVIIASLLSVPHFSLSLSLTSPLTHLPMSCADEEEDPHALTKALMSAIDGNDIKLA
jgi:hypothetical protein